MKPIRVVTLAEFAQIQCNRCGACCEGSYLGKDPRQALQEALDNDLHFHGMTHEETVRECALLVDMWRPVRENEGRTMYGCIHFARDTSGMGICRIYERRPTMCRDFPYGQPQAYPTCSWHVEIAS